ncbi:MAG: hypothetical protein ACHP7N_13680 [Caulobacterales bacterium]
MYTLLPLLVISSAVVAALFAFWRGDTATRIAGAVSAVNAVALPLVRVTLQAQVGEVLQLTADFFWAVGLLILVVRFASPWLGVTMLLQAVQFSLHAYYLVMERPLDRLHAWINNLDTTGISIAIVIGTVLAWRRRVALAREDAEREARRQKLSTPA